MDLHPQVFLVEPFGHGGIAHYTFCLASALQDKGVPVSLITAEDYELQKQADFPVQPLFKRPAGKWAKALSLGSGLHALAKEVKRRRPDVVHFQGGSVAAVDGLFSRFAWPSIQMRADVVYTAHNILPHTPKPIDPTIYRMIYRHADALIVHAESNLSELADVQPRHAPVHVIPHGDYQIFNQAVGLSKTEARAKLGLGQDAKVFLFFGSILPYKGLDTLLKACPEVFDRLEDSRLLVVGDPREDFSKYQRLIDKAGIGDRVTQILEYVPNDEMPLYFTAADLAVLPYKKTYQSGVVYLAQAFGLPAICSNTGGLGEVITEGLNGFLFESEDEGALARLIIKVLGDPALAQALGENGRRSAEDRFSWGKIAERTLEVYGLGARPRVQSPRAA